MHENDEYIRQNIAKLGAITSIRVRLSDRRVLLDVTYNIGGSTRTEEAQPEGQLPYMLDRARDLAKQHGLDHFFNEFGDKVHLANDAPPADRYPARSRLQREIARIDQIRMGISAQLLELDDTKEALEELLDATVKLYRLGEQEAETFLMELTDKWIGKLIDKKLLDGEA